MGRLKVKTMKKILVSLLIIAAVVAVGIGLVGPGTAAYADSSGATIWTDKDDYGPGETVTIFGSGFNALAEVTITIERPDGVIHTVYAVTDDAGSFTCTYQLDGIEGTYTVTATDETNTANTTFTDVPCTFSITIGTINEYSYPYPTLTNPIHLAGSASAGPNFPGQLSQYQVQVDWGDGTIDPDSTVNFVQSGNDFSGDWSSSPDHNYATGGAKTITVKLYHQKPPGAESGDAIATAIIEVVSPTVNIVVTTSPSGLSIVVDSVTYTAPQTFNWVVGSTHSIGTTSPQSGGSGIQYVWTSWSDSGDITHNIVVPSTSTTYTAYFTTQYKLTMATNFGTTSPSVGDHWYDAGTVLTISAPSVIDGEQYVWNGWTGIGTGSYSGMDNPATDKVTMNAPISETASWTHQYRLTVASTDGGSVTDPGEGTFTYDEGTVVDLLAVADSGYQFVNWSGDLTSTDNPVNITMDANKTVTATFAEIVGPPYVPGCFIATAAYGTPMAKEIEVLRQFRDKYLLTNPVGEALVNFYYRVSPPIAEFITDHPTLKPVVRAGLAPAIAMSTVAVNTTFAQKMAIVSSLALISTLLVIWFRKRAVKVRGSAN